MKEPMNESLENKLRELNWRRPLSGTEQAELLASLAQNSNPLAEWQSEAELTRLLTELRDVPVPSNFTARVLEMVELDAKRQQRGFAPLWSAWLKRGWLPKTAIALLIGAALFGYHSHNVTARSKLAHDIAAVSGVASVSGPYILEDFEAIRRLDKPPTPDKDLLALLQ